MENQNNRKEALRKRIEDVLKNRKPDLSDLGSKTLEEILQEVSIYHQELEYQNLELQRVYDELEKSQSHYVELFQDAPMGYVVVDEANKILSVNKLFAGYFDSKIEEIKGNLISQYIHPDFQDQFYLLVKKVHKEKAKSSVLVRLNCKKETFVKLECNIQKENGKVYYRMGFLDVTREVINEQQLIESRERYRAVADYAYHWEYWQDQQGRLLYMSPSCERITGYTKYEFFDNPRLMEDIIHPDDKHHFDEHKSVAIIPGETRVEHIAEYRITRKDGEVRWIGHACQSIFKEDGTHIGQRATNRDITERKKIREMLTENLNLLSNTQELAHIGSWELDVETSKLIWSDEIYRIFGIDPQQFEGSYEKFLETVHPDDREAVNEAYVNSLRDDANTYEIEHRIVRRDNNEVRYVYEKCYHERDNNGRVIRSVGMVQDITERKQREHLLQTNEFKLKEQNEEYLAINEELNQSNEELRAVNEELNKLRAEKQLILNSITDMVMYHDLDFNILWVNKAAANHFNRPPREVVGDKCYHLFGSENYECDNCPLTQTRETGNPAETVKHWADGRVWQIKAFPSFNSSGVMVGVVETVTDITEQETAKETIKKFSTRLANIIESTDVGTWEWNVQTGETIFNERWASIVGYTLDEISPVSIETWKRFTHPDDLKKSMEMLEKHFNNQTSHYEVEFRMKHKDGSWVWVLDKGKVIEWTDEGKPLMMYGTHTDITERKNFQAQLADNEQYLRTILQTTTDGFWVADTNRRKLDVNEAYLSMSGYTRNEFLNLTINDIDADENPTDTKERIERIVKNGSETFETRHRRKDGTIFDVEVSATFIDRDGGQLVCFCRDITERKKNQQRINLLANMLNHAPSAISVHDLEGNFLYTNEKNLEYHGYTYDEIMVLNLNQLDVPESKALIDERIKILKETGEASFEVEHFRKDGSRIPLLLFVKTVDWFGKNALLSIGTDLTDMKKAKQALVESEERFKLSMEATNDGLWDWNVKAKQAYYSPAYYTMLGYEVGGFATSSSDWKALVHPDDFEGINEELGKCVNSISDIFDIEFRMKSSSGEWIWVYSRGKVVERDKNGKALRMVGTHVDITQRKNYENEISKRELLLNKIFDVIPIGLWFTDEKGTLQRGNPAGVKIWGAEPTVPYEEYGVFKARRLPSGEEIAPDDWALAHTIKDGKTITDELIEIDAFDGQKRVVLNYTAPVLDNEGKMLGAIVVNNDVTKLHEAERHNRLLASILERSQDFIGVADVNQKAIFVNKAGQEMLGLDGEETVKATKIEEYFMPEDLPFVRDTIIPTLQKEGRWAGEFRFRHFKTGKPIPVLYELFKTVNTDTGEVTNISTVTRDISQIKQAEQALQESEEKFRSLISQAAEMLFLHDSQGNILEVNNASEQNTGYTREELLSMNVLDIDTEVHDKQDMRRFWDSMNVDDPPMLFDGRHRRKDGTVYDAEISISKVVFSGNTYILALARDISERKKAEFAIKAKTAELEAIYNNSPLMMCILDEHQNVVYANNYLVEFFGKPYDEIINGRACGVFGCINASEHKLGCGYGSKCPSCDLNNAIAQTIKTGQSLRDVEYNAVVDFLGENKDISLMAYTSLIKTQKKLVSLIFVDVSERKQMEDALRESEEMMRSSQSVAQICSYSTNLNEDEIGKSAWVCSPEFYNIFGIDDTYPHTIEGWANFIHPDYRDEVFAYHESVVKEKKSFNREYKIIRINDGAERWVLGTGELVYDANGKPIRMYGAIQDITERKHTEQALRESEERFRGLYENATVGIYRTTPDGQILLANPALVRMLEYSSFEELTRRNLNNKDYETGFERTEFMRLIEERGEVKGLQSGWRTKSGKIIDISESARAVYDNKGKVLYYEGIVEDITERKKAVDALRASQERISSIFRVAPIGIGVVVNRVLTEVNQTICDIIGYAKDELLGQSAQILYPTKEEFEYVGKEKYRQITEKGTGTVETIWQRKDGSLINVLLSSTPIVPDDLTQGVTFTALDITQRKQTERLMKGRLKLLEFADTHSLPELLKETLAVAEDLTGSQIGFYHFIDEEKGVIKLNQWSERTEKEFCKVTGKFDMHYPIDKAGVWVECVKKRKPIIHNDYQALAHRKELPKGHALVSRELTVPVIRNKRIVAVLGIGNKATNYCKNDIDIITQLADMAWDIAERKMAEEQVLKLSKGIEQSPATVVITDIDGNIEFVNPMFTEVTGYTAQEAMGQNPRVLKSDFHTQEFYRELWDTIKGGNDWRGELCNRKKGGELYWESASISPIKNENGEIVNFIAVKEDITDRKNAILALEQNNRLINTMLDNLLIGIFMVDAINGKPIIANEHAKKLLGRGIVDDASTETLSEVYMAYKAGSANLYPTEEMPIVRGMNGQASYVDDMEVLQPDGNRVFLEVYGCPVYNSNGEVWASLVGFTDITERKKAEVALRESELTLKEKNEEYLALNEELTESNQRIIAINHDLVVARQKAEESDKLKSAFLANMSHEIRTPMNAIIGFSEMLLNPNLPNERKDFFAQILNTACHQLLNVVEDVIDISKIETGQMEVHQSEVQINQTLSRIKEIFLPQANSNGVQITTSKFFPDGEDRVITDANKLNQVLTNLVSNAVKFTDSGTIQIAYSVRNKMLEFSVSDTGVGIDREHHELIFERFRQVEMGSTRQYGGTGLGLPISKSFVEMLGGTIWLESEPGKGSAFFFTIPYYPTQMEETSRLNNDVEFNFTGKTILIAEDEEANFLYINELIEETGATIIRATNGQEAIDVFFSDAEVNIILMDIKMPKVGGLEATAAIRQRDKSIPIIALTAYAMSSDREKCLSAGCNKYLSKPVRRNELLRAIADIIM